MLIALYDYRYRVFLGRLSGTLSPDDLMALRPAGIDCVAKEGPSRGIVHFSGVREVAVPTNMFVARRKQKSDDGMSQQDRVFVMPEPELFGLGRLYSTYQRLSGHLEPLVVSSVQEAYDAFQMTEPNFQPRNF
jgi:hypothetical protein